MTYFSSTYQANREKYIQFLQAEQGMYWDLIEDVQAPMIHSFRARVIAEELQDRLTDKTLTREILANLLSQLIESLRLIERVAQDNSIAQLRVRDMSRQLSIANERKLEREWATPKTGVKMPEPDPKLPRIPPNLQQ